MNRILPDTIPTATTGWARTATAKSNGWYRTATCTTCLNGCECTGPNPHNGCEHYGCWGPAATGTCPDVPAMREARAGKVFQVAA